ncbi:predicted protein [Uncinocarpus reesii 1704]|uniref:Uncharacterized protein n=1 Tax=Uncinocarpus reesii (strain UAMH 1704) TaxID=336963 RepID=C4JRJ9_UNCRE|nr:uncharacterized protein UREG_05088 [Uncinocarpus reesii 1704]EEP80246.1 predicted protein [Uncinocarpus reesii 1704]
MGGERAKDATLRRPAALRLVGSAWTAIYPPNIPRAVIDTVSMADPPSAKRGTGSNRSHHQFHDLLVSRVGGTGLWRDRPSRNDVSYPQLNRPVQLNLRPSPLYTRTTLKQLTINFQVRDASPFRTQSIARSTSQGLKLRTGMNSNLAPLVPDRIDRRSDGRPVQLPVDPLTYKFSGCFAVKKTNLMMPQDDERPNRNEDFELLPCGCPYDDSTDRKGVPKTLGKRRYHMVGFFEVMFGTFTIDKKNINGSSQNHVFVTNRMNTAQRINFFTVNIIKRRVERELYISVAVDATQANACAARVFQSKKQTVGPDNRNHINASFLDSGSSRRNRFEASSFTINSPATTLTLKLDITPLQCQSGRWAELLIVLQLDALE